MSGLIVDLFAGGGGASAGIRAALGRDPDIAINHDAVAVAMHAANHPETTHYQQDVWAVLPRQATRGEPVDLLWASPDCFVPGTLVISIDGLKPIEEVREGDFVLTHRNRWRKVTSTLVQDAETIKVRGQGHYGLITTPGHSFYSKRITTRYPNRKKENGKRVGPMRTLVENPYWPEAERMSGKMWATPRVFPASKIPICKGIEFSEDFFYFLGRWIGDGSINKSDVEICCGTAECDEFEQYINEHPIRNSDGNEISHRLNDHISSKLLIWGHVDLAKWLIAECGNSCETKRLPFWCLSVQRNWREALLRGYIDADGHRGIRTECNSVSKQLSIGIRLLAVTLGHCASLYLSLGRDGQIEGRSYIGKDSYRVAWFPENQKETSFLDRNHLFTSVKEVTPAGRQTVISLQVEEDESFVADGIVVHNCTHFSRAKGGPPIRDVKRRDLAWVVVRWAEEVRPRVICLENVEEFKTWGPLDESGRIIDSQKGTTFRSWVKRLRRLGYTVEFQCLRACDYGAPTSRKRLFMVARCDGQPIVWPAPTHGDPRSYEVRSGKLQPWRTAAEIIDWSIPCPSIFDRKKPLAENTLKRIAEGIRRYVLDVAEPFIVGAGGPKYAAKPVTVNRPLGTIMDENHRHLVTPHLINLTHGGRVEAADEPLNTITCAHRGEKALVIPHLQRQFGQSVGNGIDEPVGTITAGFGGKTALVTAFMAQHNGGVVGHEITEPVSTLTHRCTQQQIVASNLVKFKGTSKAGQSVDEPLHTIQTGQHYGEVRAFLVKYFGTAIGQDLGDPTHTLTSKDRMGLVTVMIQGEPYVIADIGMRMLAPRELFRAQGFDDSYQIDIEIDGRRVSKSDQVRLCGNSVCPPIAEALVRANCVEYSGAELRRQMRMPL